jgi:D-arabinose 1-dehydrogenase-like Zn-dependent alcohol dehydrogenase
LDDLHSLEKFILQEVFLMVIAKARAVDGPDKPFRAAEIERRDLDVHDVLIEIKYAGICHSDIHTAHGEWGGSEVSTRTWS